MEELLETNSGMHPTDSTAWAGAHKEAKAMKPENELLAGRAASLSVAEALQVERAVRAIDLVVVQRERDGAKLLELLRVCAKHVPILGAEDRRVAAGGELCHCGE